MFREIREEIMRTFLYLLGWFLAIISVVAIICSFIFVCGFKEVLFYFIYMTIVIAYISLVIWLIEENKPDR